MNIDEKIEKYFDLLNLYPSIPKKKIFLVAQNEHEEDYSNYLSNLKKRTESIKNTQLYQYIQKYMKKSNNESMKEIINEIQNNVNNDQILILHLDAFINILNIIEKLPKNDINYEKKLKTRIFKENYLKIIFTLSNNDLPFDCYLIFILLMKNILSFFQIENSQFYKEKMISVLLDDIFIFYNLKISIITDIVKDDFAGFTFEKSKELILKFLNVLIFLILPKNQNINILNNIYLSIDKLNSQILPYTFEFMVDILFYYILYFANEKELYENKSNYFLIMFKYFSNIIKLLRRKNLIYLSRFNIGKILVLVFITKSFNLKKLSEKDEQYLNPINFIYDQYNEEDFLKIVEISFQLISNEDFYNKISESLSSNIFDKYNEDILNVVFTSNSCLLNMFLEIKEELNENVSNFLSNNLTKLLNRKKITFNLIDFINSLFFEKKDLKIDENKKKVFFKRNIQYLLINFKLNENYDQSILFKLLENILINYGNYFEYEWILFCSLLSKLKMLQEFFEKKETILLTMLKYKNIEFFILHKEILNFILIKDKFTILPLENLKFEIYLSSIDNFQNNFNEFFEFYVDKFKNGFTSSFYIQCFYSLLNILRLYYIKNHNSKISSFIESFIQNKYSKINHILDNIIKVKNNYWYKCLIDILILCNNDNFFINIVKSYSCYITFIVQLIKKLNQLQLIEKLQKLFDCFSEDIQNFINFISLENLYIDKDFKIYFSKNDFMNSNYKSYIILEITNDEKIEKIKNDNDNEIAFLDLRKKLEEFFNVIINGKELLSYLKILNHQLQYMKIFFKYSNLLKLISFFENYLNKVLNENENKNNKEIFNYIINILCSFPFNVDYSNKEIKQFQTFYEFENNQIKEKINSTIFEVLKNTFQNTKKNDIKTKLKDIDYYLIELLSISQLYIISNDSKEIKLNQYFDLFINYSDLIQNHIFLNFEALKFFYMCRDNIIQSIDINNVKNILYLIIIFGVKRIPQNVYQFLNKELKINNENGKKNKIEEPENSCYYFTDLAEIILTSYFESEIFQKEYINLLKKFCKDDGILESKNTSNSIFVELLLLKLFIDIPRNNIEENLKGISKENSLLYIKNKGLFEVFQREDNSFDVISRKGIYSIHMNINEIRNNENIIIKKKENKIDILDKILNQKKQIEIDSLISEEEQIKNNLNDTFILFLESFSPFNNGEIKRINEKQNLDDFDNLSTYFNFSSAIIYLKEDEKISYNYKNIFETNRVSENFIYFLNSLGNIKCKDEYINYINYKNSNVNINFELIEFKKDIKNLNNYCSCIIFLESANLQLTDDFLQNFKNFPFLIIIYPLYDSHHLIKIKKNHKKEYNYYNFPHNFNIYVKDNYSIFANILIKYIICMAYYTKINENELNGENNCFYEKVNERLKTIQKISESQN